MTSLNNIQWHRTVKTKMTTWLILTIAVVMAIAGLVAYKWISDFETARLTSFANIAATRLSKSLETPMWNIDRLQVADILDTEMAEQTVVGLRVKDENGEDILAARSRTASGEVVEGLQGISAGLIRVQRSVTREGKSIGSLDMFVTRQVLEETLKRFAVALAVLVAILAFIIYLLMSILLSRIVVGPLVGLADTADAISRGDLNQEFTVESDDEIGYLADAFRKMQMSLRIAMQQMAPSAGP